MPKDDILKLSQFGSKPDWAFIATGNPNDPLTIASNVRSETITFASSFDERTSTIKASADHTATGIIKRLEATGDESRTHLTALRERMSPVIKAKEAAIVAAKAKAVPPELMLIQAIREGTVFSVLKEDVGNDPLKTQIAFRDAIEAGDFELCRTIENSPPSWRGRPDAKMMETLTGELLEVEQPQLSEEVKELSQAISDVDAILDAVERTINEVTGTDVDTITAKANAG